MTAAPAAAPGDEVLLSATIIQLSGEGFSVDSWVRDFNSSANDTDRRRDTCSTEEMKIRERERRKEEEALEEEVWEEGDKRERKLHKRGEEGETKERGKEKWSERKRKESK